jgi:hypothetical protein
VYVSRIKINDVRGFTGSRSVELIDPTVDNPFEHLRLLPSVPNYHGLTAKGMKTIEVCGLNRDRLVRGRAAAYTQFRINMHAWVEAWKHGNTVKMADIEHCVREHPFADICESMLSHAQNDHAEFVFDSATLDLLRLPELRGAFQPT